MPSRHGGLKKRQQDMKNFPRDYEIGQSSNTAVGLTNTQATPCVKKKTKTTAIMKNTTKTTAIVKNTSAVQTFDVNPAFLTYADFVLSLASAIQSYTNIRSQFKVDLGDFGTIQTQISMFSQTATQKVPRKRHRNKKKCNQFIKNIPKDYENINASAAFIRGSQIDAKATNDSVSSFFANLDDETIQRHIESLWEDKNWGNRNVSYQETTNDDEARVIESHSDPLFGEIMVSGVSKAAKYLSLNSAKTVFDIGCGPGKLIFQIFMQFPSIKEAFGYEIIESRFNAARKALSKFASQNASQFYLSITATNLLLTEICSKRFLSIQLKSAFDCYQNPSYAKADAIICDIHSPLESNMIPLLQNLPFKARAMFYNSIYNFKSCQAYPTTNNKKTWFDSSLLFTVETKDVSTDILDVNQRKKAAYQCIFAPVGDRGCFLSLTTSWCTKDHQHGFFAFEKLAK